MRSLSSQSHLTRPTLLLALLAGVGGCAFDAPPGESPAELEQGLGSTTASSAIATTTSVSTGVGGAGGAGGAGGGPLGFWRFDDCAGASTALEDSSGNGLTATRTATTDCVAGIDGSGVAFDNKKDGVSVPDNAILTWDQNLTAAAWVNPTAVSGSRSIVNKRTSSKTSFDLSIQNGNAVFAVTLSTGAVVTSKAPITAGKWTHVAGLYDGKFAFLFIDGQQVGQVAGAGHVKNVSAPISIGNSPQNTQFGGSIDDVFLSNQPMSASDIAQLACFRKPSTFSVNPASAGPVQPNTLVTYNIAVQNHDVGACQPNDYFLNVNFFNPGISAIANPSFIPQVAPGKTATFPLQVSGTEEADPGVYTIPFDVINFSSFEFLSGSVNFELAAPTGCFVRTSRELMVRDLSVVEDPVRTTSFGAPDDPRTGVWTFAKLMRDMAPTPEQAPDMVEQMFDTWLSDQTINTFNVPARPAIQQLVLDTWPRTGDGKLDLTQAPLRLLAIVNRIDVRDLAQGNAGEGRFVFGVLDQFGNPQQFTLIVEYRLPAASEADVLDWANRWHALGALPFPSEQYNAALQDITTRFAGRGAEPGRVNGSALGQLRTNEIALNAPWELREFHLAADGFLRPATVKLTPDLSFDGSQTLADYVNANAATILAEKHTVPETFEGVPFLGGSSFNNLTAWSAPGILDNDARHKFSLNTCNGCHGASETGTFFLHVNPRFPGQEASLSGFLTGITVGDPITGAPRTFNDLGRRNADLKQLVCTTVSTAAVAQGTTTTTSTLSSSFIKKGIGRVH